MNTFINRTLPAAASSYNILRKIENIPSIFSLPYFAVHNPKSRDVFYTVYLLYGAIYRAQLIRSFVERFNGKSLKILSCHFPVSYY